MTLPRTAWFAAALIGLIAAGCHSGAAPHASGRPPTATPADPPSQDGAASTPGADRVAWQWKAPPPASVGMPAADDRDVAFTYGHQHVVLLDGKGTARWDVARLGVREVAPTLTADLVLVAADDGMVAFRRADGTKVWDTALQARANTPVLAGGLVVTSTWEGDLIGLDPGAGSVKWKVALGGAAIGPPATDGTTAVVTWEDAYGKGGGAVAVDAASGRKRWAVPLPAGGISGPTVTRDGSVVAVAGDLAAHALALATGQERWRTPTEGAGSPEVPPVPVGRDVVLVAHRLGGLDLLDTAAGGRRWQVRTDGAAVRGGPVVGPGGSFAFPLDDGRLVLAGPSRPTEFRRAPGRISGLAVGPDGLLVASIGGAAVNTAEATPAW